MPWDVENLSASSNEDLIKFKKDLLHAGLMVYSKKIVNEYDTIT
jgi:hypothetical protein